MKTAKASTAVHEDDDEPRKIRSSRSKRRRARRSRSSSSSSSESPPRKRSKKHSKRGVPDKKSKRNKVRSSSRRHRHRSLSPSRSPSSSPSSSTRHSSSTSSSSSASERSVSPPPRSRSRDVTRKKGRGRERERARKGRKVRRPTSSSGTSPSSGSSRSRSRSKSKSRKHRTAGGTKVGATRYEVEKDYTDRRSSRSHENMDDDDVDRDEEVPATVAKKGNDDIHGHKKNVDSEKMESSPSKNTNETEVALPAAAGANSDAEDLELILRKKALENFRKFRAAATMSGKANNFTTGKEASTDSPQNASTKVAEATHFQRQGSSLGMRHSAGSPRPEDRENGTGHSWKQESSAGMSRGAGSSGILEAGDAGVPTQQKGRTVETTYPASQFRSPQDDRNRRSVMQRLSTPGSSASVNQRLATSAGVSHVSAAPRIRSVVSIPAREGLDGSTHTTASRPSEGSAVQRSSEVGLTLVDINKAEGTNGENRKTSEASTSNGSVPSPAEDKSQARIEDKDGFEKKTFSRKHDGETVEVSYKVYIPKKTPALARRKLQR